MMTLLSSILQS